jgi:propionyl-CoA carboxylase alpha chain
MTAVPASASCRPRELRGFRLVFGLLDGTRIEALRGKVAVDQLATVEAMKMENVLRAERDGTVAKIRVKPGDSLAVDDVILEFA